MSSHEDITLVNLHMQVNKPIIDSPLLMASYVTHLAQLRCTNWCSCCLPFGADAFSTPLFQQTEDGGLVYIGKNETLDLLIKIHVSKNSICVQQVVNWCRISIRIRIGVRSVSFPIRTV